MVSLDQVVAAMLNVLNGYLPPPAPPLPQPSVGAASLTERAVGLGNHRGTEARGSFPVVAQKGVRLEALARFQLWAQGPVEADQAVAALSTRLLADRDVLWGKGFLRLALESTQPAESVPAMGVWRTHADYRVLYEYRYQDTDGAEGLIARIPIDIDKVFGQSTIVTDEMARWDNETTPVLVARGRVRIGGVSSLAFIPGAAPTGQVTMTRTFDGAAGVPAPLATLADFLAAVAGPGAPNRHARVTFGSLTSFLASFSVAGAPVAMGDWDANAVLDQYNALVLSIEPAIDLPTASDRFEIAYQAAAFDKIAVVYLRTAQSVMT